MAKSLQRQRQRLQSILPKSFELQIRRYAPAQGSATRHLWASDQVVRPCTGCSYEASDFSCVAGDEPICGCHFVVRGTLTCELQSPSHLQKGILLDAHVCHDLLRREYLSMREKGIFVYAPVPTERQSTCYNLCRQRSWVELVFLVQFKAQKNSPWISCFDVESMLNDKSTS